MDQSDVQNVDDYLGCGYVDHKGVKTWINISDVDMGIREGFKTWIFQILIVHLMD